MMAQKEQKFVEDDDNNNNNICKLTMCILLDSHL